jgi:MerR family copper efflux transcriptional regulator
MSTIDTEMNIGELARRSGVPSTALRYYEKAGLLPESPRTHSGYRTFQPDTLPRLAFIRAAQAVGLTLAEIREVISIRAAGAAPCAHVLELIERHRNEVRSRIRELQRLERDLDHLASQGAGVDPSECDPEGVCKVIPSDADRARTMQRGQVSGA